MQFIMLIIPLKAGLQPNIRFIIWCVFTRSAITLPKVNLFGWKLEHSEHIVAAGCGRFWAQFAQ